MDGFTRLATGGCPPIADLMLALAAEFRDVDADAADQRLDELALPLFGLAGGDLRVAAAQLANVLDTDLAFAALLGLTERFERLGDTRRAAQATLLRSRLPLRAT